MRDWAAAAELTPSPDGPLQLTVTCHADRSRRRGARHPITLHEDWSITTPHDLDAERVAVALGGYLSCGERGDPSVPGGQARGRRRLRIDPPPVRRAAEGRWLVDARVPGCCADPLAWRSARRATEHLRSLSHVAAEFGTTSPSLGPVATKVLRAHGAGLQDVAPAAVEDLVGREVASRTDAEELWASGLSPVRVRAMHEAVAAEGPLPVAFYLGVLSRRPDLDWVRDTARAVPDRADESWLAWTETPLDRADPQLRRSWLALGVTRLDVATLTVSAYGPDDVRALARLLRVSPTAAGGALASWVVAGATPDLPSLVRVLRLCQPGALTLASTSVDAVLADLRSRGWDASRQDAAFALAVCGTPAIARQVLPLTASLEPQDIASALADWNDDPRRSTTGNA